MVRKSIYILGQDGVGWSIDKDRKNIKEAIEALDYKLCKSIFRSEVVFCVWWNLLSYKRYSIFLGKKTVVATLTNDPKSHEDEFKKIKEKAHFWVYSNQKQRDFLIKHGVSEETIFYNPYYVSEREFRNLNMSRIELCKLAGIEYQKVEGKFLIGSFQRDSLGSNLAKPKWQKNPDLFIEIVSSLDREKILVLLAGPRRHYIRKKLKEIGVSYVFVGDAREEDDLMLNNLEASQINMLYNLSDLYLVTSASEGGPKAIIEAALTDTPILSTDVGIAREFLSDEAIVNDFEEFVYKTQKLQSDSSFYKRIVTENRAKTQGINTLDKYEERVKSILENVMRRKID